MELLLLGIFSSVLLACISTGVSVIYAMFLRLATFLRYGLKKENDDCHLACKWFHCIYRLLCISDMCSITHAIRHFSLMHHDVFTDRHVIRNSRYYWRDLSDND